MQVDIYDLERKEIYTTMIRYGMCSQQRLGCTRLFNIIHRENVRMIPNCVLEIRAILTFFGRFSRTYIHFCFVYNDSTRCGIRHRIRWR